jgi:hypothetical protein
MMCWLPACFLYGMTRHYKTHLHSKVLRVCIASVWIPIVSTLICLMLSAGDRITDSCWLRERCALLLLQLCYHCTCYVSLLIRNCLSCYPTFRDRYANRTRHNLLYFFFFTQYHRSSSGLSLLPTLFCVYSKCKCFRYAQHWTCFMYVHNCHSLDVLTGGYARTFLRVL